jgi:hypothetical protein
LTIQFIQASGSTALAAATAKTILVGTTTANVPAEWIAVDIHFDGVTATAVPVLAEFCTYTNSGTGTTVTPARLGQAVGTAQTTWKNAITVEPTGPTVLFAWWLPPTQPFSYQWPLGRELFQNVSTNMGVRLTAPAVVNTRVNITIEE